MAVDQEIIAQTFNIRVEYNKVSPPTWRVSVSGEEFDSDYSLWAPLNKAEVWILNQIYKKG